MADTEVKASVSLGATESPSPSPSAAFGSQSPDAPTRVNHVQPLPTASSAYRAIANLNRGFEQVRRNLTDLQEFNLIPQEDLIAWGNILGRLQAEASLRLIATIHHRLMNNALYYDRLCLQRERQLRDPDDVLIEAEHRKQELAEEQKRTQQESEPPNK